MIQKMAIPFDPIPVPIPSGSGKNLPRNWNYNSVEIGINPPLREGLKSDCRHQRRVIIFLEGQEEREEEEEATDGGMYSTVEMMIKP